MRKEHMYIDYIVYVCTIFKNIDEFDYINFLFALSVFEKDLWPLRNNSFIEKIVWCELILNPALIIM